VIRQADDLQHGDTMDLHHQRLGSDTDLMVARLAKSLALLAGDTKAHLVSTPALALELRLMIRTLSATSWQRLLLRQRYYKE
jgi:hypothetical protein